MPIIIAVIAVLATIALARDDGRYSQSDPSIKRWIENLTDKIGNKCCDTADGYDVQWDIHGGQYVVYLYGAWHIVPDIAVLEVPNKLGAARIWYTIKWGPWKDGKQVPTEILIRCFLPSALY